MIGRRGPVRDRSRVAIGSVQTMVAQQRGEDEADKERFNNYLNIWLRKTSRGF